MIDLRFILEYRNLYLLCMILKLGYSGKFKPFKNQMLDSCVGLKKMGYHAW